MNFDDAATVPANWRHKGKLFNKPTRIGTPGVDVREGCHIDYRDNEVNTKNLIGVLKGDQSIGGRVLLTNENSKIFFYYADHGAPGVVGMPVGKYLYADKLYETFQFMHENKMYKEMVVYMEACESGSMFENILADDMNIYAVSAANASESSWATYCAPNDRVNGLGVGSCLGDLFSVNWMEDSDKGNMSSETLQDQYNIVKQETKKSHVLQWGQLSLTSEPIGDFEAGDVDQSKPDKFWNKMKSLGKKFLKSVANEVSEETVKKNEFAVDSRDVKLHQLYYNYMEDQSIENAKALQSELSYRKETDALFEKMFPLHVETVKNNMTPLPTQFDCYRTLVDTFEEECGKFTSYSMKHMKYLVSECEGMKNFPEAISETITRMKSACAK